MKRFLLRNLLALILVSFSFPLWADPALPKPGPLTAQVQDNGIVIISGGQKPVGYLMPQLFLKGWKIVFFSSPGLKDPCDAVAKLPDGSQVNFKVSIKADRSSLKVHCVMEPQTDVQMLDDREAVALPYEDWEGDGYEADGQKSVLPKDIAYSAGGVLAKSDGTISIGPSHAGGLTVDFKAKKLHGFLQDARQWTPDLSVYYTHQGPGVTEWLWKAGEKKVFDFTLTFNRKVEVKPLTPPEDMASLRAQIDELVKPVIDGGWCTGMAVGVLLHGKTMVWGYGKTSLKDGPTPDGDTEYEIGSITKLFTKLLFSDMAHRGQMGLNDKAQAFLPPDVKLPTKDGKEITLLTLSNHTSGLRHDPETWDINKGAAYSGYTLRQLYDYLSHCQLLTAPGEKFSYSNTGVALLGDIVAQKNGTSWEAFVQKRVLDPVGMKDTGVRWNPSELARAAQGYDGDGGALELWDWKQSPFIPAGSLHSTVNDLLKLAHAALVKDSSPLADIAFDDIAEKLDWGRQVNHDGGTYGFNTSFHVDRDKKTAVVVLGDTGTGMVSQTAERIRDLVEGKISTTLKLPEITDLPGIDLRKVVGKYQITQMPEGWGPKPDGDAEIYIKDGKLYGHGNGHGWFTDFRIYPLTNGDFYIKKESLEIALTQDPQRNVTGYTAKDYPAYVGEKLDYKKPEIKGGSEIPPPP